ncbi:unnamed protein product, partial [Cladocopium goreaui]
CMAGDKEEAGTWQHVTASNPPAERVTRSSVVIDAQQRIWIFGGFRYRGRYQGVDKGMAFFNDLHYFDTQARAWHEVTASNAPSVRNGHTSVIDAQQRIWVFGGYYYSARLNDLHYFDIQAKVWHEVSAQNAPPGRSFHTAVMDAKQRMWIFGGNRPPRQGEYNDLHYFDIQAKTWQEVKASNPPSPRAEHTAVMDAQQRMWIFGGDGVHSGTLHYFDIQAKTWQQVKASNAPSKKSGHTAVMDAQQQMWIFGGYSGNANNLHYFDIQAKTWQQVNASNPFERYNHGAVMDVQQRMWIFGGFADDYGTRSWNDLRYFDTQGGAVGTTTPSANGSIAEIIHDEMATMNWDALEFSPIYRCFVKQTLFDHFTASCADKCDSPAVVARGQCVRPERGVTFTVETVASWSLSVQCNEACWNEWQNKTLHYTRLAVANVFDIPFQEVERVGVAFHSARRLQSGLSTRSATVQAYINTKRLEVAEINAFMPYVFENAAAATALWLMGVVAGRLLPLGTVF